MHKSKAHNFLIVYVCLDPKRLEGLPGAGGKPKVRPLEVSPTTLPYPLEETVFRRLAVKSLVLQRKGFISSTNRVAQMHPTLQFRGSDALF